MRHRKEDRNEFNKRSIENTETNISTSAEVISENNDTEKKRKLQTQQEDCAEAQVSELLLKIKRGAGFASISTSGIQHAITDFFQNNNIDNYNSTLLLDIAIAILESDDLHDLIKLNAIVQLEKSIKIIAALISIENYSCCKKLLNLNGVNQKFISEYFEMKFDLSDTNITTARKAYNSPAALIANSENYELIELFLSKGGNPYEIIAISLTKESKTFAEVILGGTNPTLTATCILNGIIIGNIPNIILSAQRAHIASLLANERAVSKIIEHAIAGKISIQTLFDCCLWIKLTTNYIITKESILLTFAKKGNFPHKLLKKYSKDELTQFITIYTEYEREIKFFIETYEPNAQQYLSQHLTPPINGWYNYDIESTLQDITYIPTNNEFPFFNIVKDNLCDFNDIIIEKLINFASFYSLSQTMSCLLKSNNGKTVLSKNKVAIFNAIRNHNLQITQLILETSHNAVYSYDHINNSILHIAALEGHLEIFTLIINMDRSLLSHRNVDGYTPAHLAAANGNVAVFNLILTVNKTSVLDLTNNNSSALHLATENGHLQIAQEIVHVDERTLLQVNANGDSAMHIAAACGYINLVKLFQDSSIVRHVLQMKNNKKQKSIHLAASNCHANIVACLAEMGPSTLTAKDTSGATPLFLAIASSKYYTNNSYLPSQQKTKKANTITTLIRHDQGKKSLQIKKGSRSPLQEAIRSGQQEIVNILVQSSPALMQEFIVLIDFKKQKYLNDIKRFQINITTIATDNTTNVAYKRKHSAAQKGNITKSTEKLNNIFKIESFVKKANDPRSPAISVERHNIPGFFSTPPNSPCNQKKYSQKNNDDSDDDLETRFDNLRK